MLRTPLTCAVLCLLAVGCASAPSAPTPAIAATTSAPCFGPPSASRLPQSGCDQGQTYSQEDVRTTGQPTAAAALQTLDPLVHH